MGMGWVVMIMAALAVVRPVVDGQGGLPSCINPLTPCLEFVKNGSTQTQPSQECCTALTNVHMNDLLCVCQALTGNNATLAANGLDPSRAAVLPSRCNMDMGCSPSGNGPPLSSPSAAHPPPAPASPSPPSTSPPPAANPPPAPASTSPTSPPSAAHPPPAPASASPPSGKATPPTVPPPSPHSSPSPPTDSPPVPSPPSVPPSSEAPPPSVPPPTQPPAAVDSPPPPTTTAPRSGPVAPSSEPPVPNDKQSGGASKIAGLGLLMGSVFFWLFVAA